MQTFINMRNRKMNKYHPKMQEHMDLLAEFNRHNLEMGLQWVNLWYNMVYGWHFTDEEED